MTIVEPRVFIIAEKKLDKDGVQVWLDHLGGGEVLDHIDGRDNEQLVELAARRCYKSFAPGLNPNVTKVRTNSGEYHDNILSSGHGSVLEHADVTFAFEDVSRVFTHEFVRHRQGLGFSQESLRYVRLTNLRFWIPPVIDANPEARALFVDTVERLEQVQRELARIYDVDNIKNFKTKKHLTSAFRRVAPIGLATGIVASINFRALRWVIENRSSFAAEEEFRIVIDKVASTSRERWPHIFGDFSPVYETMDSRTPEWSPKYRKV